MPYDQRLPTVAGDDGTWGNILNQFLEKEHYNTGSNNSANGGHQKITIRAGTASAGTAPLKFTSGTLLTSSEAGAVEFNTDSLYFTVTTGPTRKLIALIDYNSAEAGDMFYWNDTTGDLAKLGLGGPDTVLTSNGLTPEWRLSVESTSVASTSTPAPTGGSRQNEYYITALAANATFSTPSGTPANGNLLLIRIVDNGTPRTLNFTTSGKYRAICRSSLPSTTTTSKTMYLGFKYNSESTGYWDLIAYAEEA